MIVGLTWLTMEKHRQNLPKYQLCAIMGRSKLPLDFNSPPGPPKPSTSTSRGILFRIQTTDIAHN
jgi:hypothetical protein